MQNQNSVSSNIIQYCVKDDKNFVKIYNIDWEIELQCKTIGFVILSNYILINHENKVCNSVSVEMLCWPVLLVNMSLIATFSSQWNVATISNCNPS